MTEPDDAVVVTREDREWARGFLAGGELYWYEDDMAHALARHRQQSIAPARPLVEREALAKVERHLSTCQYDPAPYTCLKHRLRVLASSERGEGA